MNKKTEKTLNEYIAEYVYSFLKHSFIRKNEEKKGKILGGLGRTGAETLSIYLSISLSIHLSFCLHTSDGVGFLHRFSSFS